MPSLLLSAYVWGLKLNYDDCCCCVDIDDDEEGSFRIIVIADLCLIRIRIVVFSELPDPSLEYRLFSIFIGLDCLLFFFILESTICHFTVHSV